MISINITNKMAFILSNESQNNTVLYPPYVGEENFLNKLSVQILLVIAYTFVFCCCFIGNSLVIAVLALNRGMRTATNFFLLNLAIADLCVALFCVYQNLSLYLSSNWAFGDLLCRMYHFIHALSYTASVYTLVSISVERYLAVVYPLLARRMLTINKLKITLIIVWLISAVCCIPRFFIYGTVTLEFGKGNEVKTETLCILKQKLYDPKLYDVIYITICFAIPLMIITVLYLRVCYYLWTCPMPGYSLTVNLNNRSVNSSSSSVSSINMLLKRRKKVIKLLVIIVLAFAIFSTPFHARKLAQHYVKAYNVSSEYATMFTIFTTLFLYMNSGINPLLYIIFSKKLRKSMFDVILRPFNRNKTFDNNPNYVVNCNFNSPSNGLLPINESKSSNL